MFNNKDQQNIYLIMYLQIVARKQTNYKARYKVNVII